MLPGVISSRSRLSVFMQTSARGTGRGIAEFQGGGNFLPPFGTVCENFQSFHSLSWPQDVDDFSVGENPLNSIADVLNVDNKFRDVVGESGNGQ